MEQNQEKICDVINKRIVAMITEGHGCWVSVAHKYKDKYVVRPINYATGYEYKGANKILLPAGFYLTYKQLTKLGGKLKKDKNGNYPQAYTIMEIWVKTFVKYSFKDEKTGELKENVMPKWLFDKKQPKYEEILFTWNKTTYGYDRVYNIDDCEGYKEVNRDKQLQLTSNATTQPIKNRDKVCDFFIDHYLKKQGIKLFEGKAGSMNYYNPLDDSIHIASVDSYTSANDFYEKLFHECSHSTGAEKRLNRKGVADIKEKIEDNYAQEEVIAELSAMYCLKRVGLLTNNQLEASSEYMLGWLANEKLLEAMKNDKTILIKTFANADKAQQFIFTE